MKAFSKPWCAVCGKLVADLKNHEKQHPGCYVCSCGKQYHSSEDLRRHARKSQHLIPCKFRGPSSMEPSMSYSEEEQCVTSVPPQRVAPPQHREEEPDKDTFVVVKGESSRVAPGSCCSICGERVEIMKEHERRMHPGHFACAECPKSFSCTEDLRRHSRSTGHRIPLRFSANTSRR
eukprot:symbB.v1.2.029641.t1/scaffold3155.1/size62257/3